MTALRLFWILIAIVAVGMIMLMVTGGDGTTLGLANDEFASALWLAPLLVLVAAGVLQGQRNFGHVFQSLLIWAAILLVISAAYIFRHDFREVGARLFGGLVPGMSMTTTMVDGREQVIIGKRRDGHFTANVEVDGVSVAMLVDTGASRVTLTTRDAERIGFDAGSLSFTAMVSTANGNAMAAPVTLDEVAIGPITRRNVRAMVAGEGLLSQSLLGMSFLGTLSSVDMRAEELRLTD
ncbi:TIGR02281 family clan AA aspartic protease [Martelella sp. AD-3]|uniref:TIGR02281 family clan AA aspartic protease n=1 Tax=Martelella sp. AD-3 TaxID=686597 RepID=UPI0004B4C39E|nr:TIGR02281 family clan AA aspartic protease [Martelella sp. AD-3]